MYCTIVDGLLLRTWAVTAFLVHLLISFPGSQDPSPAWPAASSQMFRNFLLFFVSKVFCYLHPDPSAFPALHLLFILLLNYYFGTTKKEILPFCQRLRRFCRYPYLVNQWNLNRPSPSLNSIFRKSKSWYKALSRLASFWLLKFAMDTAKGLGCIYIPVIKEGVWIWS